ncbi:hypothetical protein ABIC02_007447, partial [Bradyrhizobium sp. RT5a]
MSKVTPEHLARQAVVYIRQSTPDQVAHNLESKRRQYNLPERARQLGWSDVAVIDDDLGRSGGGAAGPGFEKLLAAICEVRVGVARSKRRGSHATVATGTRCSSSASRRHTDRRRGRRLRSIMLIPSFVRSRVENEVISSSCLKLSQRN